MNCSWDFLKLHLISISDLFTASVMFYESLCNINHLDIHLSK